MRPPALTVMDPAPPVSPAVKVPFSSIVPSPPVTDQVKSSSEHTSARLRYTAPAVSRTVPPGSTLTEVSAAPVSSFLTVILSGVVTTVNTPSPVSPPV